MLLLMLFSAVFVSVAAAQETADGINDIVDGGLIAPAPEDEVIAPAPDEDTPIDDDEQIYHILDNRTVAEDTDVLDAENGEVLIATNTGANNTLAIVAVVVIAVAVVGGAIGIVYHRRNTVKA